VEENVFSDREMEKEIPYSREMVVTRKVARDRKRGKMLERRWSPLWMFT
jgi:hypothetical protein